MWSRQAMNDDQIAAETRRNIYVDTDPQLHHLDVHADESSAYPILPGNATFPIPNPQPLIEMFPSYFRETYPTMRSFDEAFGFGFCGGRSVEADNDENELKDSFDIKVPKEYDRFKDINYVLLFGGIDEDGNDTLRMADEDEVEEATDEQKQEEAEAYEEEDSVLYMSPSGDRDMSQSLPDPQDVEDTIRKYCATHNISLPNREIVINAPVMDESRYSMVPGLAIDFSVLPQDDDDLINVIERIAQENDMWLY